MIFLAALLLTAPLPLQDPPEGVSWLNAQPRHTDALDFPGMVRRCFDPRWMYLPVLEGESCESIALEVEQGSLQFTADGMGAVTRLWLDAPSGTLKAFVDGADEACFTWDLDKELASEDRILGAPLFMELGDGFLSRIPIGFREGLRLQYEGPATQASVTVRRFGEGQEVESMQSDTIRKHRRSIRYANQVLVTDSHPEILLGRPKMVAAELSYSPKSEEKEDYYAGDMRVLHKGHGVLRWFDLQFVNVESREEMREILRSLVVRVEENTSSTPEIGDILFELPLGDFFGSSPGVNPYRSHLMGFSEETATFYFRVPMPFHNGLKVSLASDLERTLLLKSNWGLDPYAKAEHVPPLRLHGGWVRRVVQGPLEGAALELDGPARLLGYSLSTTSSNTQPLDFGRGPFAWADGVRESTPGALEQPTLVEGPGAFGHNSLLRLFGLDSPTQADGWAFDPQVQVPGDQPTDFTAFAWWYSEPGVQSNFDTLAPSEKRLPIGDPIPSFHVVRDASEFELNREVLSAKGSRMTVATSDDADAKWSRLQYVRWTPSEPMQMINFGFPVLESGTYELRLQLAKGADFGSAQVLVDGKRQGEALEMHADGAATPSGEISLGEVRLMKRDNHKLAVMSLDGKPVGLDYFRLVRVQADK